MYTMFSKLTFYFNYTHGIQRQSRTDSKKDCVDHIVKTFYEQNIGKIVNVKDMLSEYGCFFIITFNKETWNMNDPVAKELYTIGFEQAFNSWAPVKYVFLNDNPIWLTDKNLSQRQIYLTSLPEFNIENKKEHFNILGEFTYEIMWCVQEHGQENEVFKIVQKKIDKSNYNNDADVDNDAVLDDSHNQQFYEDWAAELDKQSRILYYGNYDLSSSLDVCMPNSSEYRYDLTDIIYEPSNTSNFDCNELSVNSGRILDGCITDSGYIAYNKEDFINYYGCDEGKMRWSSNIYSAPYTSECASYSQEIPEGCKFKYNFSYLILKLCVVYYNEDDFNMGRSIIRKYVDVLWSLTDATDKNVEQKPVIRLQANYNDNKYNLCCWYDFKYTNLKRDKLKNVEKLIQNFKSHHKLYDNMIDWIPSVE